jgi:hypothetical protein
MNTNYEIKPHLDIYNVMQLKVAKLLELLSDRKITDCNFVKIRSNHDAHDHENLDSEKCDKMDFHS